MQVYLPAGGVAERPDTREPTARGTESILLVEDEPRVRAIAVRTLTGWGYRVLEAQDATSDTMWPKQTTGRCTSSSPITSSYQG